MPLITYYGHSCFTIQHDNYTIALDPYDNSVPGYKPLHISANEVLCSHGHGDHCYTEAVAISNTEKKNPFEVYAIESYHDPKMGSLRGSNVIRLFIGEDLRIAHFGDIGCRPTIKQMELLGNLDLAMVPVGGTFTLDARAEKQLMDELKPRIIIPMHYRHGKYGYDVLDEVSDFTDLYRENDVHIMGSSSLEITDTLQGVYVLQN